MEKPERVMGFIFACTNKSQDECFERMLFGASNQHGAMAIRVKERDFVFLLNLETDLLYGVFRAKSDGKYNIQPEAWSGKYPYQTKVVSLGNITPLENAKKLLDRLGLSRTSPIGKKGTLKLIELFRPYNMVAKEWQQFVFQSQGDEKVTLSEPRTWDLLGKIQKIGNESDEFPLLESTTSWDFPRQSYGSTPKGDNKYAGVTPAFLIWNLIWRYTVPGDLVVDPMCGSGTTIDVCKEEKRKCICFDVSPPPGRNDIIKNDSRKIPLEDETVDLIFVDSPYGDNVRYNDEPANIGNISSETELFYDELEKVISECHRILKPGKVLGWLIGDQWVKKKFTPVGFRLYNRLNKYFDTVDVICIVRRGQSSNTGLWHNRARRFNFYLRGFKYLFIMRKKEVETKQKRGKRKVKWAYYER